MKKITYLLFFSLLVAGLHAQDASFDKARVVKRLASIMNRNYVYPEKGKAMHDLIKKKQEEGAYDSVTDEDAFADQLEADLRSIINDKHIRVRYDTARVRAMRTGQPGGGRRAPFNFGFQEVKKLEGNIGYLDLRGFADLGPAEDAARKAMDELMEADAIIFDLRRNGGGSPSMIRFISSYIFGEEPVHLNDFYWRPADRYDESWTDPEMASMHKPDIPVYVLTSNYTFSAAEEFTYNLKHLKRATVIGEVTGGGAHPGGPAVITGGFIVNVPRGRAINPITKTNWEGIGVIPHIELDSDQALDKALELAKKALAER